MWLDDGLLDRLRGEDELDPAMPRLDRLVLGEILGKGGMGIVHRAFDPRLERHVAVKVLSAADRTNPEMIARFWREARTAGSLRHPGIVGVHEVGASDGVPFVVMELVEGTSLSDHLPALSGRPASERAALLRDAARAVAHAHAHGIVHRDIKPSNIMIDTTGRPRVLDFGLARRIDEPTTLTATGQMVGTPGYMAPEQIDRAMGEVGPPSDVFAFGAILYELLTGTRAFESDSTAGLIHQVLFADPKRPVERNPSTPRDLETICLRCLDKEPKRRYRDAGALADDLDRWLAGEPIEARPTSLVTRMLRQMQRNRVQAVSGLLVGILAAAATGLWGYLRNERDARRIAESQAAASLEATRKAQAAAGVLVRWGSLGDALARLERIRYDSTLPPEERRERAAAPWAEVARFLADTPPDGASQATARAFAGWARVLACHEEQGIAWLQEARKNQPDLPFGSALHALTLLSQYLAGQIFPDAVLAPGSVTVGAFPPESEELRRLRGEIDALLQESSRAGVWGEGPAQGLRRSIEAVRALQQERFAEADAAFTAALRETLPGFRSDLLLARSKVRLFLNQRNEALQDLAEVLRARPENSQAHAGVGRVHLVAGHVQAPSDGEPRERFRMAEAAFGEAARLEPGWAEAWIGRGLARVVLAQEEAGNGGDPRPGLQAALVDLDVAVRLNPESSIAHHNRGFAHLELAGAETERDGDPLPHLLASIRDETEACRLAPDKREALHGRGDAWLALARLKLDRGEDPCEAARHAIADLDAVLVISPDLPNAHNNRGTAWLLLGRAEELAGGNGRTGLERAIADHDAALALNPTFLPAMINRGLDRQFLAEAEARRGGDPGPNLRLSREDLDRALENEPGRGDTRDARARTLILLAQEEIRRGTDPRPLLEAAMADLAESLRQRPDGPYARTQRGLAGHFLGAAREARGEDPSQDYLRAIQDLTAVILANPNIAGNHQNRGVLHVKLAMQEAARGIDPRGRIRQAIEDHGESLRRGAPRPAALGNRGSARALLAQIETAYGRPTNELLRLAEEDLREARELGHPDAEPALGGVLLQRNQTEEAIAVLESAMAKSPPLANQLQPEIARARALACEQRLEQARRSAQASADPALARTEEGGMTRLAHRDQAFDHLECARTFGRIDPDRLRSDPNLAPLHDDPRFAALLEKIK